MLETTNYYGFSSFSNVDTGHTAWQNPSYAYADDGAYARFESTVCGGQTVYSDRLYAQNWQGPTATKISPDAIILGIRVNIQGKYWMATGCAGGWNVLVTSGLNELYVISNGSVVGVNHASGEFVCNTEQDYWFGATNDAWSSGLTRDKLASSSSGLAYSGWLYASDLVSCISANPLTWQEIDKITMSISYDPGRMLMLM